MKKFMYVLILLLVVVSGLVFANREIKNETKPSPKPLSIAEKKADRDARRIWEASPDGIKFNRWKSSPEGKKVYASHDKIREYIKAFADMEAVVTSVLQSRKNGKSWRPNSLIVRINGEKYMMQFNSKEFQQLSTLKVNDKILVRSPAAGYSPNHPYLIIWGDYIEQNSQILYKRDFSKKGGC